MRTLNISADGDYDFDNIYTHKPSVVVAQIVSNSTFTGTITFEKKVLGSILNRDLALYIDDLLKQVANAPIVGPNLNKIVIVDSAGAQVTAKVTGVVAGSVQIDYVVLEDTFPAFKVASGGGTPTADVNVVTALPAGNNNIGDVDIASIAAGDNNIGNVDIVTMPNVTIGALPAITGTVALDAPTLAALESITIGTALPAGNNNIGDVDIASIPPVDLSVATLAALETIQIGSIVPVDLSATTLAALESITIGTALPAGNNNIGDVDIATLPAVALDAATLAALESISIGTALPVGANVIGKVDINSSVALALDAATLAALESITIGTALPAGGNTIGNVGLVAGAAVIGKVDINSAIPAGANIIGKVDVNSITAGDNVIGRVKLSDGTTLGKITPASTAVVAADPALIVALHPLSPNFPRGADLNVTQTAAVNVGATCTLPAPAAGLFHYITRIELVKLYSVIGVAAGAGVLITSTNLPGNPIWTTEQLASAAGTATKVIANEYGGNPLKSSVAATATTLVAPAQLQTIWRWNVSYYTAP